MTFLQFLKRILVTWILVSALWFALFTLRSDNHGSRMGRALAAGFFMALCTAPGYYLRLKRAMR